MKSSGERMYFPYEQLEEFKAGMWRIVRGEDRKRFAVKAAELMRNHEAFKAAMMEAIETWPISCQQNLTAENTNRIAWLGHAGCCIAVGSCEENTRIGWHMLTPREQALANDAAASALEAWASRRVTESQPGLFDDA